MQGYSGVTSLLSPTPSAPPFPAAKTKSVFAHAGELIASRSARENPELQKLPFTTRAPFAHAYWIELMIALVKRLPEASPAPSGMIDTSQLTPVTPRALLPRAPIVPAT